MVINILLLSIALIALIIGTITDIRTREVPDWVNFGLIFTGVGIRLTYSLITFNWSFIIEGLIGLVVAVLIAYLMFYTGQWGGGDAKLLMGLGALIGLPLIINPIPLFLIFLVNALLIGALYGLVYSFALAFIHRKEFKKHFKDLLGKKMITYARRIVLISCLILLAMIIFLLKDKSMNLILFLMVLVIYLSFYLIIFVKAVELSAMYKIVEPYKLTEGDWIAKEYKVDGKKICSPKDLGVSKKQIKQLVNFYKNGKIGKIKIKEGIPFVPSFLIAFILSFFGAWWMLFI